VDFDIVMVHECQDTIICLLKVGQLMSKYVFAEDCLWFSNDLAAQTYCYQCCHRLFCKNR